jgi:AraC family transcriptional regulator
MQLLQTEPRPTLVTEHVNAQTSYSHMAAVERVIQTMHASLAEPLSLEDMADIACLSPYYFNRVFHQSIGIPPGEFLATLRLNAAKRLLLTTSLNVTEICFAVGYNGLGTFTTRFTQLIGLSPRRLRVQARNEPIVLPSLQKRVIELASLHSPSSYSLSGQILSPYPIQGNIFIGLFPRPIPQGRPVSCLLLSSPGPFRLGPVPLGKYFLLIAALPSSPDPLSYLLPTSSLLVGVAGPFFFMPGLLHEPLTVFLRPARLTDPPILSALPYL